MKRERVLTLADAAEELWFVSVAQENSSFIESAGELVSAFVVASSGARISDRYASDFFASTVRSAFGNVSDLDFGFDVFLENAVAKLPLSEFSQLDFSTMSMSELVSYRDKVWSQYREVIELKRERTQSLANAISVALNASGISVPSELGQELVDIVVESSSDHFARSIDRLSQQQIRPIMLAAHLELLNPDGETQYPQQIVHHYIGAFESAYQENVVADMRTYESEQVRITRETRERLLDQLKSRPLPWERPMSWGEWFKHALRRAI